MDHSITIVEFTRVYLAVFYSCVAAFYALRITAKKRSVRGEVVFAGARFSTTWWNHRLFGAFRIAIWMVCLLRWLFPAVDNFLGMFVALNVWPVILAGNILLTAGFMMALGVHFSLGRQWRSGIDPGGPEELRTDGFYGFTRNPMFIGIAVAQTGFFLALPSAFSAVCLSVGLYTLRQQTLAEEAHLEARFTDDYRHYREDVPRWL
jgi:protein-S-isoprenylcysteine O-methyltransferase Ste14